MKMGTRFKQALWKALDLSGFVGSSLKSFFGYITEPFTGAWQREVKYESQENLLRNSAIYACVTGIAADVAKMRIKLCEADANGIWTEITANKPWLGVLRKPNHYQNRIQFFVQWIISKLLHGNAFIFKSRDARGVINQLYVLDPHLCVPLVTPEGDVYYSLNPDPLSGITDATIVVAASEIIHDMMPALWHPLVGVAPLYACAMAGSLGNKILKQSMHFFDNEAMPGGVLTVPGDLSEDKLKELKQKTDTRFSGENRGKTMVLTGGMTFNATQLHARNTQLAEQLKLSVEEIARAYHYPMFKLGGPVPTLAGNVESLITTYYTDCLQSLIECAELCLDEGLELPTNLGTEFDLDNLLRMDTSALFESNNNATKGGWMKPNEARFRANMKPVPGGDTPYLQQQNFSLAALAKRDKKEDPFAQGTSSSSPSAPEPKQEPTPPGDLSRDMFAKITFGETLMELNDER
jgi:HK97 family phage portal protein